MALSDSVISKLPVKQRLAIEYKPSLIRLSRRYPITAFSIANSELANNISDLLGKVGVKNYKASVYEESKLTDSILTWQSRGHLILLNYKPSLGNVTIVNLFRALKRQAPLHSNDAIIPIFIASPDSKKQHEMFKVLGHFGIKYACFLTPNASPEEHLAELLRDLSRFEELINSKQEIAEPPPDDFGKDVQQQTEQVAKYKKLLADGDELIGKGEFEEAIKIFTNAISLEPAFDVLMKRGDTYYKVKRYASALIDYREANTLTAAAPDPYAKIGKCCFSLTKHASSTEGNDEKAAKWFEKGIQSLAKATTMIEKMEKENKGFPEKRSANPYGSIVSALAEADFRDLKNDDFANRVEKLSLNVLSKTEDVDYLDHDLDIDIRIEKAILLTRNGRYDQAERIYREIIVTSPSDVGPVFNNFAIELRKNLMYGKAFEIYLEILRFDVPDRSIIVRNMITAGRRHSAQLRDEMKYDESVAVYKNILHYTKKSEGTERVLCDLALTYLEMQEQAKASACLIEAIYINPAMAEIDKYPEYKDLANLKQEIFKKLTKGAV